MKKIKLIATLSTAIMIGGGYNILTTSCSSSGAQITDKNTMIYNGNEYEIANNINPNIFCELNSSTIANVPLESGEFIDVEKESLTSLTILNVYEKTPTSIDSGFLYGCNNLTSLTLPETWHVTNIGKNFLCQCYALESLTIPSTWNVTQIGERFLSNCRAITTLDLSGFSNVETISNYFLERCNNLTTLILPETWNVSFIGQYFMTYCNSIETLNFPNSPNLTEIKDCFLDKCSKLKSIDLSNATNLNMLWGNFLRDCTSLTSVNLSGCTKITTIRNGFLSGCTSLANLSVPLKDPTTINVWSNNFMLNVPTECSIHAGDFANAYKQQTPWNTRADHITNN